jgi:hypothetical protein
MRALIDQLLALSSDIRYVAVYLDGDLTSAEKAGLAGSSAAESDRYEELLVNPTLITLARQRGDIDCGGLQYLVVRYGNFFQFIHPVRGGHVSVAVEPQGDPLELGLRIRQILEAERLHGPGED